MRTSVTWLNDYLDPPATAEEQAELLTNAGFPLDGKGVADNGEPWQEIEITSNRGDCLCHLGFAREVCAVSGRRLVERPAKNVARGPRADSIVRVTNERPDLCPLYTARVIRGVTVRPSPEWLQRRLVAVGLVPRNNLVDATNFVLFELGQPTHVFDLSLLHGQEIRIRMARSGEPFLPIGEGAAEVALRTTDLVIADADRPVAIAGVKGGALTAVRDTTRDILLEAATFSPVAVRATSRALRISSDSSYRFERGVHAAEVNPAAERLVELILELAGGELCEGTVSAGATVPALRQVTMRAARCRSVLGIDIPTATMIDRLTGLGFAPERSGDASSPTAEVITCTVPARRIDIEREIDLIEEVCRTHGLRHIQVSDRIPVRVAPVQSRVAAARATKDLLAGLGFVECVTHTLISDASAAPFLPAASASEAKDGSVAKGGSAGGNGGSAAIGTLSVDDERAGGEPTLRPSLLPSLLRVRRHNLDQGTANLDLFESAAQFHLRGERHSETPVIGLLVDGRSDNPADRDECYRRCRGVVERIARLLGGPRAAVEVTPCTDGAIDTPWFLPGGRVTMSFPRADGSFARHDAGTIGLLSPVVLRQFGLERTTAGAELALADLFHAFPPDTRAVAMPAFPGIERDVSAIVAENVSWAALSALVTSLVTSPGLAHFESMEHVATYRGKQTGEGRKSVTMRVVFRSNERTLRSEEVDAQMESIVAALRQQIQAEVRSS
jgi:phenylalanyl-tRNA synthetase beta chain